MSEPQHQLLFSKQRWLNPAADESPPASLHETTKRLKRRRFTDVLRSSRSPIERLHWEKTSKPVSVWTRWQRAEERRGEPDPPGTGSGLRWDNKSGFCCRLQPQLPVFSSQIFLFLLLLLYLNRMERRVHGVQRRSPLSRPRALLTGRSVKRMLLQINLSSLHLRPLVVRLIHSNGVTFPQTAIFFKVGSKRKGTMKTGLATQRPHNLKIPVCAFFDSFSVKKQIN